MSKWKVLRVEPVIKGFRELRNDPVLIDKLGGAVKRLG